MKLALLGTGMIVKEVLPVLENIKGIDLLALLSTPRSLELAKALADRYGIPQVTSDYESILSNSKVNTVYVALPNHLHYQYAKKALLSGKHVICEKPFTLTLAEFDELRHLANDKHLILLEAITNQYLGNFQYLKNHLSELGDIKIVECNYSQYSSRYDAFKRGHIAPAFDVTQGGGALRDLNIYNIHLVVGLFGKPKNVCYLPNMERQVDTSGVLIMDYGSFKAVCIGAKDCSAEIKSTIQGNRGSLSILGPTNALPEVRLSNNNEQLFSGTCNAVGHRMQAEFEAFQAIIANEDFSTAKEALEHSRLVMEVLDSAISS